MKISQSTCASGKWDQKGELVSAGCISLPSASTTPPKPALIQAPRTNTIKGGSGVTASHGRSRRMAMNNNHVAKAASTRPNPLEANGNKAKARAPSRQRLGNGSSNNSAGPTSSLRRSLRKAHLKLRQYYQLSGLSCTNVKWN